MAVVRNDTVRYIREIYSLLKQMERDIETLKYASSKNKCTSSKKNANKENKDV